MAGMDRFIATAIRLVRIDPEAPTIMPATIMAVLLSASPAAATDNPVRALRSEMTTGMSAPPMGEHHEQPHHAGQHQDQHDPPHRQARVRPMETAAPTAPSSSRTLAP